MRFYVPMIILIYLISSAFFQTVRAVEPIQRYECKKTHLLGDKTLDQFRDKMILEVDLNRPAMALTATSLGIFTGKSTYHADENRNGDGVSFKGKISYSSPTVTFDSEYWLFGKIKFNFETRKLSFLGTLDIRRLWECMPMITVGVE